MQRGLKSLAVGLGLATGLLGGCAHAARRSGVEPQGRSENTTSGAPGTVGDELALLRASSEAQARRIRELESRLALRTAEVRELRMELEEARRARREVVRIGHREGCEEREGAEVFAASDVGEAGSEGSALVASTPDEEPRPVLRLYGSPRPRAGTDLPALSGPAAPSIVAAPPRATSLARLPVTGPPGAVDVVPPIPERPLLVTDPVTRSSADVTTSAPGDAAAEGSPDGTREGFGGSVPPRSAGSVTMSSAGPGVEDPVVREYRAALGFVEARRWNDALGALARFAAAHPDHPYADNALYWQGEVLYAQREYRRAMEILETMIRRYPRGNKVPDALLRLGYCSLRLGDPERARTYFERVRREHPDSVAARLASREET